MGYETLLLERDGGVLTIIFNRPDGGMYTITEKGLEELKEVLLSAETDNQVRCVVLTANGKAFCAGAQMSWLDESAGGTYDTTRNHDGTAAGTTLRIAQMLKPVIAAVNGVAVGGGLALALCCDMRIAADTARFGYAYGNIGISPDMGASWFVTRIVGPVKSLELYYLNELVPADQALRLGLVNRVVPAADLRATAHELALRLAAGPTVAFGETKRLISNATINDLPAHIYAEGRSIGLTMATEDAKNAIQAFVEKRRPEFKGR